MTQLNDDDRALFAKAGIDPAAAPDRPTSDDVISWMAERARDVLERVTPPAFRRDLTLTPELAKWVAAYIADPAGARPLLLAGNTGVGKSHQAYQAVREVVLGRYGKNHRPRWRVVKHPQFNRETRPQPNDANEDLLERYSVADLLLFDDLGAGQTREWGIEMLLRLADYRTEQQLPTIWTTNLDAAELIERVGDRVMSRIFASQTIVIEGPDRRQQVAS
jgi:DNA replication protein DnaC